MGPYTHQIDPILFDVAGVHLWWYGLGFALGFLHLHLSAQRYKQQLGLSDREVWSLSLFIVPESIPIRRPKRCGPGEGERSVPSERDIQFTALSSLDHSTRTL